MITRDLFFSSQVTGAAQAAGLELVVRGELPDDHDFRAIVLDLGNGGCDPAAVMEALGGGSRPIVVAYCAHVQAARIEEARAAGCDQVLTRGQFSAGLADLMASFGGIE